MHNTYLGAWHTLQKSAPLIKIRRQITASVRRQKYVTDVRSHASTEKWRRNLASNLWRRYLERVSCALYHFASHRHTSAWNMKTHRWKVFFASKMKCFSHILYCLVNIIDIKRFLRFFIFLSHLCVVDVFKIFFRHVLKYIRCIGIINTWILTPVNSNKNASKW